MSKSIGSSLGLTFVFKSFGYVLYGRWRV